MAELEKAGKQGERARKESLEAKDKLEIKITTKSLDPKIDQNRNSFVNAANVESRNQSLPAVSGSLGPKAER